uniref:Methyltransferase FkbM family n=1 Tax=Caulobacter sp. (strain K31) TaxID=366602 RepID=B0T5A2_CAUSK
MLGLAKRTVRRILRFVQPTPLSLPIPTAGGSPPAPSSRTSIMASADKLDFAVPQHVVERFVQWHREHWQPLEYLVYLVYRNLVRPGDTVIDGGAHAGLHTEGLARAVYPGGWVHAIEPNPAILARLKSNLAETQWRNIVLHEAAVGDDEGEAEFFAYPDHPAVSGLRSAPSSQIEQTTVQRFLVPIHRLGTLLADAVRQDARRMGVVRFMKLDLEGWELNTLRGCEDLLADHRPNIVFEFSGETDPAQREILQWLSERDYLVFDNFFRPVTETYLTDRLDVVGQMSLNFVAAHVTRLDELRTCALRCAAEMESVSLSFIQSACDHHFRPGHC